MRGKESVEGGPNEGEGECGGWCWCEGRRGCKVTMD